jgi:hypothetical protein
MDEVMDKNKKMNDDLPEWVRLVGEYASLKEKTKQDSDVKKEAENSNNLTLNFRGGVYGIVFRRIVELEKNANLKSGIIRFPILFTKLCTSLQITKKEAWELIFLFSDLGVLEVIPYQGVRLKKSSLNSLPDE